MLQETIPAVETQTISDFIKILLDNQEKDYKPGQLARRDVHAKSHGTVKGHFTVWPSKSKLTAVGLFAEPRTYAATVRLSNGTPGTTADAIPNVRGIAIKLKGVKGIKLLTGDEGADSLDLLLSNHPYFFIERSEDYAPIQKLIGARKLGQLIKNYPRVVWLLLLSTLKLVRNPLEIDYYSQLPYAFAARSVKYALIAQKHSPFWTLPNVFDRDILRHSAESVLINRAVKFTFCLQFQTEHDSIEDSTVAWRGPLLPVGELELDQRNAEPPLLESDGEALSFNPWRTTVEHRPLGWQNRFRRAAYKAIFDWRTAKNAARKTSTL